MNTWIEDLIMMKLIKHLLQRKSNQFVVNNNTKCSKF